VTLGPLSPHRAQAHGGEPASASLAVQMQNSKAEPRKECITIATRMSKSRSRVCTA
jgi:hypothetical protein